MTEYLGPRHPDSACDYIQITFNVAVGSDDIISNDNTSSGDDIAVRNTLWCAILWADARLGSLMLVASSVGAGLRLIFIIVSIFNVKSLFQEVFCKRSTWDEQVEKAKGGLEVDVVKLSPGGTTVDS